jgi:phosphoglucosamine mutase
LGADLGVMLSASHNPMPDNGVKLFARGGVKLADALEDEIESRLREPWSRPTGAAVGRVRDVDDARERYVAHLLASLPHRLDGLRVVVDCANGAACFAAPEVLRRAGAEVITVACDPDGLNINRDCGATHLDGLRAVVVAHSADAGIAHDGDADRCIAVDAAGQVVDGDAILAILALGMLESGTLAQSTVVATVMSNLGLALALQEAGISLLRTGVGDRYVLEEMNAGGYSLGGEQSGHIILLDHASTGDGLLTALHLLGRVAQTGRSLAELASVMKRLPQVLVNVPGVDRSRVDSSEDLQRAVAAAESELGATGRVLLRPSGTEPLVRVMVEAATHEQAERIANELAAVVRAALPLPA